jgi:TolA-binding protein
MTLHGDDPKETEALNALIDLARGGVQAASSARLSQGLQAVSGRLDARKRRRKLVLRSSLAFAATAACALVVLGTLSLSRQKLRGRAEPALTYQIEGGSVIDGGYLHESGTAGMKMVFAEGTEFILMPGARGRLRSVDSLGARLAIEQGAASFQVTPRSDARWLVDVGPFLVTVKGTVFSVSWDAASERFELRLRHGRVSVRGPVSGGEVNLRAGQRLVVSLPKAVTEITEQKPEDAWPDSVPPIPGAAAAEASEGPPTAPSGPSERPSMRAVAPAAGATSEAKLDTSRGWPEAIAAGRWDRILAEVKHAGLRTTLEKASSEDLFALADAARYRRRTGLARQALLAERRRFPDSARALDAAFLLGRMEEESEHRASKALEWYDEYLARAPAGTYASEALGRKMIVTDSLAGAARTRPIADEYLRRFPNGTYAGAARALRRSP